MGKLARIPGSRPGSGSGATVGKKPVSAKGERTIVFASMMDELRPYEALRGGACGSCGNRYRQGDWVYNDGTGNVSAVACCGPGNETKGRELEGGVGTEVDGVILRYTKEGLLDYDAEGDMVPMAQVMPRGRSSRDACPKCFQIPAASGECSC